MELGRQIIPRQAIVYFIGKVLDKFSASVSRRHQSFRFEHNWIVGMLTEPGMLSEVTTTALTHHYLHFPHKKYDPGT